MKKLRIVGLVAVVCIFGAVLSGCVSVGRDYKIPMIDLSTDKNVYGEKYNELYEQYVIDDGSNYMAHPDTALLKDGRLMTMYPEGHGKGPVLTKVSVDGGKTWSERLTDTPKSWEKSEETPTIYRLPFNDGSEKIVMISAVPSWWNNETQTSSVGDGFNASYSNDDGKTWTEFKNYYGKNDPQMYVVPIVAMASLTRLKDEQGKWTDSWMGFFHDANFVNYKSILTFNGAEMLWSKPEPYFKKYRTVEKSVCMCEVEVIRSNGGNGDQLCLLGRSNSKNANSVISFSNDEGKTWSYPKETPAAYSGERHKAEWLPDGRLFITFRSIERSPSKLAKAKKQDKKYKLQWYSEGWIGWVGSYDDLVNGDEGQYRVKLAHTYKVGQTESQNWASADTGYCGNAVLPDGTVFTSTYGTFDKDATYTDKNGELKLKTFIVGKRLNMKLLDSIYNEFCQKVAK